MASFDALIEVLEQIYFLQEEMINLAENKKQVLIDGNIDELSIIIQKESDWVKRLKILEDERIRQINIISQKYNINNSNLSMSQLIEMLDSPLDKERLNKISDKLINLYDEIKELNDLNTQLIKQSLDYISNTINNITGDNTQKYTYSKPTIRNNSYSSSSRGIFDKKA